MAPRKKQLHFSEITNHNKAHNFMKNNSHDMCGHLAQEKTSGKEERNRYFQRCIYFCKEFAHLKRISKICVKTVKYLCKNLTIRSQYVEFASSLFLIVLTRKWYENSSTANFWTVISFCSIISCRSNGYLKFRQIFKWDLFRIVNLISLSGVTYNKTCHANLICAAIHLIRQQFMKIPWWNGNS